MDVLDEDPEADAASDDGEDQAKKEARMTTNKVRLLFSCSVSFLFLFFCFLFGSLVREFRVRRLERSAIWRITGFLDFGPGSRRSRSVRYGSPCSDATSDAAL